MRVEINTVPRKPLPPEEMPAKPDGPVEPPHPAPGPKPPAWPWIAAAAVLFVAFVLRVYGLTWVSVWGDEWLVLNPLETQPTLRTFLDAKRLPNPDMPELYFVIMYAWSKVFGPGALGMRWLSILFGMAGLVAIFVLGKKHFGPMAGLAALVCMALSPFQIYHAQNIRVYALSMLLATLSSHAFLNMLDTGEKKWWLANITASVLLFYTHLFGIALIAVQGLCILLFRPRRWLYAVGWGAIILLFIAPVFLWALSVDKPANPSGFGGRMLIAELRQHIYARDGLLLGYAHHMHDRVDREVLPESAQVLDTQVRAANQRLQRMLEWGTAAFLLYTLGRGLWRLFGGKRAHEDRAPVSYRGKHAWKPLGFVPKAVYLLAWLAGPPVLLLVLSGAIYPQYGFQPRYTSYGCQALYLIIGCVVAGLHYRPLQVAGLIAAAAVFAPTAWIETVYPTRGDYLRAAEYLGEKAGAGDVAVVYSQVNHLVVAHNFRWIDVGTVWAKTPEELVAKTRAQLASKGEAFVVLEKYGHFEEEMAGRRALEAFLDAEGIPHDRRGFIGGQRLVVYRCGDAASRPEPSNPSGG